MDSNHPAVSDNGSGASTATLPPVSREERSDLKILIVDDERTLSEGCASVLRSEGYSVATSTRGQEAEDLLRRRRFDIVLLDLYMSEVSGLELLKVVMDVHPETVVIIMTGNPSVNSSLEALAAGAWDYLPKPFSPVHLQLLLGRAAHVVKAQRETRQISDRLEQQHGHSEKVTLLGKSEAFCNAIDLARKVARTDASVFITGESGTGKEMIAQFIHHHSRRSGRPMVAVNCAALPETLLESEMFGHVKGAFTGAVRDKPGLLEAAHGGTLFLDELTEMSLTIQAKLLRVIQDGVVRRVGSETTDAVVNVRFIAATNREPLEAVEDGVLRKDLYYRLRVVPVRVPPLRERPDDIESLAQHFLALYWARHRSGRSKSPTLTPQAVRALQSWEWPGNVRELQNVMEHAVVLLDSGSDVEPSDIPFVAEDGMSPGEPRPVFDLDSFSGEIKEEKYHSARDRVLAEFERSYLSWLVNRAEANMSRAARIAGVDRTTLYRLMEKHGLQRDTVIKES